MMFFGFSPDSNAPDVVFHPAFNLVCDGNPVNERPETHTLHQSCNFYPDLFYVHCLFKLRLFIKNE